MSSPRPSARLLALVAAVAIALARPSAAAEPFDPATDRGKRVASELGLSLVGTWVGAGLALLVVGGRLHVALEDGDRVSSALLISVAALATCGGAMGGTFLGGHAWGANGHAGWTLLGSCGGGLVGAGGTALLFRQARKQRSTGLMILGIASALMLPVAGSVLGYELSTRRVDGVQGSGLRERQLWLLGWGGRLP